MPKYTTKTEASSSSSKIDHVPSSTTKNEEVDANFSKLLLQEIGFIKESFEAVKLKASQVIDEINETRKQFEGLMMLPEARTEERNFRLHQLKKKVSKLRFDIPFKLIAPSEQPHPNINWRRPETNRYQVKESSTTLNIDGYYSYDDQNDNLAPSYHELKSTLQTLGVQEKSYIPCFFFFPENAVIKRSVLHCWYQSRWLGHYTSDVGSLDKIIGALVKKRLIQALYKKSNLTAAAYRMYPFVHSTLRSNISWFKHLPPSREYVGCSHDADNKYIYYTAEDFERFIPTRGEKQILHLGTWNNSTEQHIEVINPKVFFKDMSKLTNLKFVSLRGISMIEKLPKFITKLKNLEFLDLKACHNLEVIPPSIANLKFLTYLDFSECYFLDRMPKALATLGFLRVLKGFVVGEYRDEKTCTLEDLASLHLLGKLNVYTSVIGFPNKSQFVTLQRLRLHSLTISWGGCSAPNGLRKQSQEDTYDRLKEPIVGDHETFPFYTKKLDLQCVPETVTRCWLKPANFGNLKKLYIRGGKFFDLGWQRGLCQLPEESQWNVETLRLKHLSNLEMDWGDLQRSFPKLICLEKVNCPKLYQFPCDGSNIWIKSEEN